MLVVTLLVAKESCCEDYLVLVAVSLFQSESYIHEAFRLLNSLQRFLSALTSHLVVAIGI